MKQRIFIAGGILMMTGITAAAQAQAPEQGTARSAIKPFNAGEVVADVRELIAERYVLPEMRGKLDAKLKAGLDSGRYSTDSPALLAERLTEDLFDASQDRHLYVRYSPGTVAAHMATRDAPPDRSAQVRREAASNYGMREMKVLPGNVRYLDIGGFPANSPGAEAAIHAAMDFLAGGDAVIIDLRKNGGGNGWAVNQVTSQFVEADKPLIRFRKGSEESPLMKSMPGLSKMVGKPLYLLTSGETASAGEELAGHVAGYKLGELVGEATAGAAFMNGVHGLDSGFEVSVSEARPVLSATGKDWERVGIAPTIAVDPMTALQVAHAHALRRLAAAGTAEKKAQYEAIARGVDALGKPSAPLADPRRYVGTYGDRVVSFDGSSLWIRQERRTPRRLVAFGEDRFTPEDSPGITYAFTMVGGRAVAMEAVSPSGEVVSKLERKDR